MFLCAFSYANIGHLKDNKWTIRISCSSTCSYVFITYDLNSLLGMEKVLNIVDSQYLQVCEKTFLVCENKVWTCLRWLQILISYSLLFVYLEIHKTCGERILDIKYVLHFTVHLSFRTFCPYKYFVSHAEGMHMNTCM